MNIIKLEKVCYLCTVWNWKILHKQIYSSICLPKNAAATCANLTSVSVGFAFVLSLIKITAPEISPAPIIGKAIDASMSECSRAELNLFK